MGMDVSNPEFSVRPIFYEKHRVGEQSFLKGLIIPFGTTSEIFHLAPNIFIIAPFFRMGMDVSNPEFSIRPNFQEKHRDGEQTFLCIFEGCYKPFWYNEFDFWFDP